MKKQISLFSVQDATGELKPIPTPYLSQKAQVNAVKRQHYDNHINSDKGKRQIDLVFAVLYAKGECTDREIQRYYQEMFHKTIDIGTIPARRADLTNDKEHYKKWRIVVASHRECKVMKTIKISWKLERIGI